VTSRIMAALLALTGGLLLGALLPLGFAMSSQYEQDYRSGTLNIAHTVASAAEEKIADHGNSTMLSHTLAALRRENAGGSELETAVVDDDGHVVAGQDTGLYTAARAASGLAGTSKVNQAGGRLLAVVPVDGHTEKVAGAVLLSRPLSPLDDRIMRLWAGLGTVAFLAIAAAIVLAVALAHWVGRPLRRLEVAAEALGAGELGARAEPPKRPSEIRRLAERFNVMAARLENLIYDHRTVLADVSHQLRTPLAALRLRMELLAEEATSDPAEFDAAQDELARLARLVDGLLAVARAENATASPEPVQVTGLLTERAEAWRPVAEERDVQLTVEAHAHLTALVPPGHLEQVIDNLVDNALTAAPRGGHVRLAARRSGHRARVTVTDDGPGMTAEAMEDAFRRFHTGRAAGTGLGLAIVHRLVTADGGEVGLSDTPGGGLTVTLDLPAER
jgi:signal transduction histidine kinase